MELHELRENIDALAQTHPAIPLAYLFGSQVQEFTGPMSDFDFAILLDRGSQPPLCRPWCTTTWPCY
jgi:hypothetical protein